MKVNINSVKDRDRWQHLTLHSTQQGMVFLANYLTVLPKLNQLKAGTADNTKKYEKHYKHTLNLHINSIKWNKNPVENLLRHPASKWSGSTLHVPEPTQSLKNAQKRFKKITFISACTKMFCQVSYHSFLVQFYFLLFAYVLQYVGE